MQQWQEKVTVQSNMAQVDSFDDQGRGVARVKGKTVFINGAMPGEVVRYHINKSKKYFDEATVDEILKPSFNRVEPKCRHFDTCGGCRLQHIDSTAQVALKERVLEDQFNRIGKIQPNMILPPIYGKAWHYRERCRLTIRRLKTGKVVLGFQARLSHEVIDISTCWVLPLHLSLALPFLREALNHIPKNASLPYALECAVGETSTALCWLYKETPSEKEISPLISLLQQLQQAMPNYHGSWQMWTRVGQGQPCQHATTGDKELFYLLPNYNIKMPFLPGDFTQSYAAGNRLMIARALQWLDIQPNDRVADWFCGIGNFTLPIARYANEVVGVEGLASLTERASENARHNGLAENTTFIQADLFAITSQQLKRWKHFDKMLLDPPRDGALSLIKALSDLPERLVYISCNSATLARDAAVLVEKGYHLDAAGVMNMFAQTNHVEAMAVFSLH